MFSLKIPLWQYLLRNLIRIQLSLHFLSIQNNVYQVLQHKLILRAIYKVGNRNYILQQLCEDGS